jgi:hypothetical protein
MGFFASLAHGSWPAQCRVRVATHNANVDAVVGYYKDVKVDVSCGARGCMRQASPHSGPRYSRWQIIIVCRTRSPTLSSSRRTTATQQPSCSACGAKPRRRPCSPRQPCLTAAAASGSNSAALAPHRLLPAREALLLRPLAPADLLPFRGRAARAALLAAVTRRRAVPLRLAVRPAEAAPCDRRSTPSTWRPC